MNYVIVHYDTELYVAVDSHPHTFTPEIKRAKLYETEAAAKSDCAVDEIVVELTLMQAVEIGDI